MKFSRPRLARGPICGWTACIFGLCAMCCGVIGNVIVNETLLYYFIIYLAFFFIVIIITFHRVNIGKLALYFTSTMGVTVTDYIRKKLIEMKCFSVVFFTSTSELHILNKAILYARDNENCASLIIAHICSKDEKNEIKVRLKENLLVLDHMYPKMKIDLLLIQADEFNPRLVKKLSDQLSIPPSSMFIRCPGANFKYSLGEFDGVRTIMQ